MEAQHEVHEEMISDGLDFLYEWANQTDQDEEVAALEALQCKDAGCALAIEQGGAHWKFSLLSGTNLDAITEHFVHAMEWHDAGGEDELARVSENIVELIGAYKEVD